MYEATDDPYCYPGTSAHFGTASRPSLDLDRLHPPAMLYAVIASFMGDERPLRD
jgi:hypothetical protein